MSFKKNMDFGGKTTITESYPKKSSEGTIITIKGDNFNKLSLGDPGILFFTDWYGIKPQVSKLENYSIINNNEIIYDAKNEKDVINAAGFTFYIILVKDISKINIIDDKFISSSNNTNITENATFFINSIQAENVEIRKI